MILGDQTMWGLIVIIENILFAALRNVDPGQWGRWTQVSNQCGGEVRVDNCCEGGRRTHILIIQTKQSQLISTPVIFIALIPGQSDKQQEMSSRDQLKISPEIGAREIMR